MYAQQQSFYFAKNVSRKFVEKMDELILKLARHEQLQSFWFPRYSNDYDSFNVKHTVERSVVGCQGIRSKEFEPGIIFWLSATSFSTFVFFIEKFDVLGKVNTPR